MHKTNKIVGEYVKDVSMGLENVYEILHGTAKNKEATGLLEKKKQQEKNQEKVEGGVPDAGLLIGMAGIGVEDLGSILSHEEIEQAKAPRDSGEPVSLN